MASFRNLSLRRAIELLEEAGSADDPVKYQGVETTPTQLEWELDWDKKAGDIRITYAGNSRTVNGTLSGMVKNRRELMGNHRCPTCGARIG